MKDLFTPDYMFASYREVTPAFLSSLGIKAVLSDIDNTLAPYEQPDPDEEHKAWIEALRAAGIAVALVSNNHADRVERFNAPLGLDAYPDSHKPSSKTLRVAMEALGVTPAETVMLGDQLLTDSYAGKHTGLTSVIVPPIKDKTNLFFRFKRLCERPFIRKYAKQHGYKDFMKFWKIKNTTEGNQP
ncbi:MAG: YqeG family HAD IIIA-type phosphatase [Clostridia bacterium]|nr:YqeG family HAD IIIA-type phosphatase [Clostridia bacterium]